MLKTEFSSNPLPASSYIPSGVPVSSSSFILPQVPAPIGHDHLVSLPPDQTSPSSSIYPAVNGFSQQANGNVVGKKRKPRRAVEQEIINQASDRVATCLATDHISVSFPDIDTPFQDTLDVVRRLLPYHVFQTPANDLRSVITDSCGKGKAKATEQDLLKEEIAETKFALECFKRRKALENRFKLAKRKLAQRGNPDDQAYALAQCILESDRAENTSISAQLRAARIELDKVRRDKRIAPIPQRPTIYAQSSYPYTPQYRHYTYPYAQYHSNYQQVYSSYQTPTNSQPMASVTQLQSTGTPTAQQGDTAPIAKAIPVQLPVSLLPSLHALKIMPVPANSLPPPDQPQPQAVLKGTTANGTMLSLEINLTLLQAAQTSGLALILNSLTSAAAASGTKA